jgi:hypothetical protein
VAPGGTIYLFDYGGAVRTLDPHGRVIAMSDTSREWEAEEARNAALRA